MQIKSINDPAASGKGQLLISSVVAAVKHRRNVVAIQLQILQLLFEQFSQ